MAQFTKQLNLVSPTARGNSNLAPFSFGMNARSPSNRTPTSSSSFTFGKMFHQKNEGNKPAADSKQEIQAHLTNACREYLTIWRAAYFGRISAIESMLADPVANINPDAIDPETGFTALILSCRNGFLKIATLLVRSHCNVNLPGLGGITALHIACRYDHPEVVRFLLQNGASIDTEDEGGNTAFNFSARYGNVLCVELLAEAGANLEHANKRGLTPFLAATLNCKTAVLDMLIKRKININAVDLRGNSALHYAAKCGYLRAVKFLLSNGINVDLSNQEGEKPEQVAVNDQIRELIRSSGTVSMDRSNDEL